MPEGRCTLPADATGRVLDRLAGLEQVIRPEQIRQALAATGRVASRSRGLTHEVMLWVVLAMGIFTDVPIRQVFRLCRRLRPDEPTHHRSSLCVARRRLGVEPVRHLFERTTRPRARPSTPGAFAFGLRLMGIDGTVVYDVPDSDANAFDRPSGRRGEGAFPQVRKLSLVELGTHAEVGLEIEATRCGERTMVAGLLRHLGPGMLLLLDSGLFSQGLWRELRTRSVEVLARVTTQMVLRPTRELADGSYLSKLHRNDYDRRKDRHGVVVRVIRYTLDDPRRVGHGEEHVLITTLLDEACCPAMELIVLYHERWEQEQGYQQMKEELGLAHHEGRSWRGFHHHACLVMLAYGFLALEREREERARPAGLRREGPDDCGGGTIPPPSPGSGSPVASDSVRPGSGEPGRG